MNVQMNNFYPELSQRILEMAEGDEEFRVELTSAILNGLIELKSVYGEGIMEKNEIKIDITFNNLIDRDFVKFYN